MRKFMKITLLSLVLACNSALAAEPQQMNHQAMQAGQQWIDGVVIKIDQKNARLTVKHAAIPGVMPTMTMSYQVAAEQSLSSLHAGDKVHFVLKKDVMTRIETLR